MENVRNHRHYPLDGLTPYYSALDWEIWKKEPPCKSAGEVQIARFLLRHGYPFTYEEFVIVNRDGGVPEWRPDFILPYQRHLIVEYFGRVGDPDYDDGVPLKREVYNSNNIPYLFLYPNDLRGSCWPEKLKERLEQAIERARDPRYDRFHKRIQEWAYGPIWKPDGNGIKVIELQK